MNANEWDSMSRALARSGSRRSLLRATIGATAVAFLAPESALATGNIACTVDIDCPDGSACFNEQGGACGFDMSGCPEGADVCTQVPTTCTNVSGAAGMCFTWQGGSVCAGDGPAFDCSLDEAGDAACSAEFGSVESPWRICARGPTCQTGCYPLLPETCACIASELPALPETGVPPADGQPLATLALIAAVVAAVGRTVRASARTA